MAGDGLPVPGAEMGGALGSCGPPRGTLALSHAARKASAMRTKPNTRLERLRVIGGVIGR
ncbi:MAG TPA: hypothetical protein VKU60_17125 [Chloroflexota bacterium]|nr:hypothetical protein [Chloroflexota bacterium]